MSMFEFPVWLEYSFLTRCSKNMGARGRAGVGCGAGPARWVACLFCHIV